MKKFARDKLTMQVNERLESIAVTARLVKRDLEQGFVTPIGARARLNDIPTLLSEVNSRLETLHENPTSLPPGQ